MPTRLSANYYREQAMASGKQRKEKVSSVANAPSVCVFDKNANQHKTAMDNITIDKHKMDCRKQQYIFRNNNKLYLTLLTEKYPLHNNRLIFNYLYNFFH